MKAIRFFRKLSGFALVFVALFLVCAADTPCSTGVFIAGFIATPVCLCLGVLLISPKGARKFAKDFVAELKEDLK